MTRPPSPRNLPLGLTIIHEDRDILVVNKPAGLLTISTEAEKERTAYFVATDYVRKGAAKSKLRVFIVHRLDRDTSGVLVFAKSEEAKRFLQEHWEATGKEYLAIVHGHCADRSGKIESYLVESSALKVYSTKDKVKGKPAATSYRVLKEVDGFSLLAVTPHTGRKNQIRVHLADLGHPIIGDKKYGVPKDGHKKLALHAARLSFTHPFRKEPCTFSAPPPGWFQRVVGKIGAEWYQEQPPAPAGAATVPDTVQMATVPPGAERTERKPLAKVRPTGRQKSPGKYRPTSQPARRRKSHD